MKPFGFTIPINANESFIRNHYWLTNNTNNEIFIFGCEFINDVYKNTLFDEFGIPPLENLESCSIKRKSEYLAGRYCVQKTLKAIHYKKTAISNGDSGEPLWPEDIIGSITHTNNSAICAIKRKRRTKEYIGIDKEDWIAQAEAQTLSKYIINSFEHDYLETTKYQFNKLLTIIFSAKECIFKALFYEVNDFFDFNEVCLSEIKINTNDGYVIVNTSEWLQANTSIGQQVKVTFSIFPTGIITLFYQSFPTTDI
jgi:4'-phosphopantetheinyl transferase EntD